MSLFGDDDEGFKQTSNSKSLFGDDAPASKPTSSSLFADDATPSDSPWGMPTPKKAARGDMVKNLLRSSEIPENYIDTFDTLLNSGDRHGGNISAEAVGKLFEGSGISQDEQSRLLRVVAPSGADAGLGRSELNVLLALIGLSQEGEEATLDGVDERRSKLPEPRLPYLDKLKTTQPTEATPQQAEAPSPGLDKQSSAPSSPPKSRVLRRDSLLDPSSDPWGSPAPQKPQTRAVKNEATPAQQTTMSRPTNDVSAARTTSNFTTTSDAGDDDALPAPSPGTGGWGSAFANGESNGLGSGGGFGDEEPTIAPSRQTRPVITSRTGGSGAEETVTIALLPEKEGMFMFQHRNYEVKSARRASTVVRRYSDFVWLLDCLHKRYPFRQLPLLPPKKLAVNGRHLSSDTAFIEKRRKGLVRFTNALVRHPVLNQEQLVVMFLTVPTELAVWRKQATISVQEEFVGKALPPGLEDSLPTNLLDTFDTVRSGVRRSADTYIGLCNLLERLAKRNQGVAADSLRFSQALRGLTEETEATYSTDANDVPSLNEGIKATAKHLEASHSLLEDEARAWDEGVLEDLKRQRDSLVSIREMFDRRDRYAKDNIPQLERRIESNESKLQAIRAKPETKPGEAEKVEQAIISDKQSIVDQHARGVFIKECIRDELVFFQTTQYHVSKLHQDWSQERVKYAELMADNWRSLSDEVEHMPLGD